MPQDPSEDSSASPASTDGPGSQTRPPATQLSSWRRTLSIARTTEQEWLAAQPWPDHAESDRSPYHSGALRAGVTIKVLLPRTIMESAEAIASARQICESGALVRVTPAEIPAVTISDRKAGLILTDTDQVKTAATWTRQPAIVLTLAALFDQAWHAATPLTSHPDSLTTARNRQLTDADRELLKLLADGATDAAAARQLGLSLRTTRRHVAALMSSLDAGSRFQAGAVAARRGWLD